MWGAAAAGTLPWGALAIPTAGGTAVVAPVVVAHLVGVAPSPAIEGQEPDVAVAGREPDVWLPTMRVGG